MKLNMDAAQAVLDNVDPEVGFPDAADVLSAALGADPRTEFLRNPNEPLHIAQKGQGTFCGLSREGFRFKQPVPFQDWHLVFCSKCDEVFNEFV